MEAWQTLIRANLDGAFYCIQAVLPAMLERKDGVIINVSSVAGKRANPLGGAAYVAAKFGMSALGIGLAAEEKDSGMRRQQHLSRRGRYADPGAAAAAGDGGTTRRILQPEDVAEAVLFVATLPPHVSVPELVIKPTARCMCDEKQLVPFTVRGT